VPKRKELVDDYFICKCCGAELPGDAAFCRHCGASDESGWGEDDFNDDVSGGYGDEDDFEYDDFLRREFPDQAPAEEITFKRRLVTAVVWLTCIALLLSSVFWIFR
jgi:hypothetical protein